MFEYKREVVSHFDPEERLNVLATDGWELIVVTVGGEQGGKNYPTAPVLWLKRRLPPKKD